MLSFVETSPCNLFLSSGTLSFYTIISRFRKGRCDVVCDLDEQHPGSCQSVTECLRVHACMLVFVQGIFPSAILIEFGLVISISNHKCPERIVYSLC